MEPDRSFPAALTSCQRRTPLEVWGGLESTFARRGDHFRDQIVETGHRDRIEDLDRVAQLGITTLRYPILWETVAPEGAGKSDFAWHDGRLARLNELGVKPIAGLVHHGSGPRYTHLLDRNFARGLARHAAHVARRYPWIEQYTPVNEPLTTARFSCLYGHWYPHTRDYRDFLTALVNQCRATLLAMRAIRRVNPSAKLVQTEDFGRVFSTPALSYQADHENERRWLTFDLLFGRVDRHHPWWRIFRDHGIPQRHLIEFLDAEAQPDVIGINHYLTSERFLDERLDQYPAHLVGSNGSDLYADVEAVRVPMEDALLGPAARLREVWDRYGAPIAVTEAHHGCTRDEQLRWLHDVWRAAQLLRHEGADIRAVTVWSLFGTVDWNSLLTRDAGIYEPGAFDIRGPAPRATALARATSELARAGSFDHPALDAPGWWRRDGRFYGDEVSAPTIAAKTPTRSVLVSAPDGPLRRAISHVAARRGLACTIAEDTASGLGGAVAAIEAARHWAVLDIRVPDDPFSSEVERPESAVLAAACREAGKPYGLISGHRVFDGWLGRPAEEDDAPSPDDPMGREALRREQRVRELCPDALVIRTGEVFGPWDKDSLVSALLETLARCQGVRSAAEIFSPTYLPDLAHVVLDLLVDGETGIRHLTSGSLRADELAEMLATRSGLHAIKLPAFVDGLRQNFALSTVRGNLMPPLSSALDRYLADCSFTWRQIESGYSIAAE